MKNRTTKKNLKDWTIQFTLQFSRHLVYAVQSRSIQNQLGNSFQIQILSYNLITWNLPLCYLPCTSSSSALLAHFCNASNFVGCIWEANTVKKRLNVYLLSFHRMLRIHREKSPIFLSQWISNKILSPNIEEICYCDKYTRQLPTQLDTNNLFTSNLSFNSIFNLIAFEYNFSISKSDIEYRLGSID